METIGSFKRSEVSKKMNFIFADWRLWWRSLEAGGIEEEVKFLAPIYVLIVSPAYVYARFLIRSEIFSFPFD